MGLAAPLTYAQNEEYNEGVGQTLQINLRFDSWLGHPIWFLNIYDIDHGEYHTYEFPIRRGRNNYLAYTYGANYQVTASIIQFETFNSRNDTYKSYKINNFCHLQTGRTIRGSSLYITVEGDLYPYYNSYTCNVLKFPERHFTIVPHEEDDSDN